MAGGHEQTSDVAHIEQALREVLCREAGDVLAVYLFGSVARGTDRAGSDIDLAVLSAAPPRTLGERFGLEGRLEERLGRTVQVVLLNGAPPDLVHRVLRDGTLLVENDKAARVRFEVAARNAYFDVLPVLERYRRARRLEGGDA